MCTSTFAQTNGPLPSTWSEIEEAAITLLEEEKYEEALALVEQTAAKLQGREFEVSDLTMNILFEAGRTEEALSVWEKGLEEGFFYFVIPRLDTFDGVRRNDRFRKLVAKNNQLRKMAQKILPANSGGLIVRTVGEEVTPEKLEHEFTRLHERWKEIQARAESQSAPSSVHREATLISGASMRSSAGRHYCRS